MNGQVIALSASVAVGLGLLCLTWVVVAPSRAIPVARRRWHVEDDNSAVADLSERLVNWIDGRLGRQSFARRWAYALDRAGIRLPIAEFFALVLVLAAAAFAVGVLLKGLLAGLLTVIVGVVALLAVITLRSGLRKSAFANHLDDVVQHLATSLRAGHSTLHALETVGREIEEPTKSELMRVVNHVRIGRDVGEALEETADRMDSDDFRWVAQAVAIHRQVGGNLGEVLDAVSNTIRERQQIRRQVKALSAEGRMSAIVLLALPVFIGAASALLNPQYMSLLWTRVPGMVMLGYGCLSMAAGAVWLRKVVTVKF